MAGDPNNYYTVLGVHSKASSDEIQKAYYSRKKEFNHNELNKRSLKELKAIEKELQAIERAYEILSKNTSRNEYDKTLNPSPVSSLAPNPSPTSSSSHSSLSTSAPASSFSSSGSVSTLLEAIDGRTIKKWRESSRKTIEEVAKTTKIPSRYISALEEDHFDQLPARVYVRGFVQNLAGYYGQDSKEAAQQYMLYFDKLHPAA